MSIEKLFDTEPDAKEVIKKREIYQVMGKLLPINVKMQVM